MNNFRISTDIKDMDISVIHSFISTSYWAAGIPIETFIKAIENSLCFGVFTGENEQVGFARMITDKATYAYLADVLIVEAYRSKGLSKSLMQAIVSHPDLQGLRRMMLATLDAHGLYAQFGFTALAKPETFMELWQPDVYKNSQ